MLIGDLSCCNLVLCVKVRRKFGVDVDHVTGPWWIEAISTVGKCLGYLNICARRFQALSAICNLPSGLYS